MAATTEISREERLQAGSLTEAFYANACGLTRGDVLIRQIDEMASDLTARVADGKVELAMADRELVHTETVLARFRFDREKGRYLFVRCVERGDLLLGKDGAVESGPGSEEFLLVAFARQPDGSCVIRYGNSPAGKGPDARTEESLHQLFMISKVPSLEAAGLVMFGSTLTHAQIESAVSRCRSGDTISRIERGEANRIRIYHDQELPGGTPSRSATVFDLESLVPVTRSIWFRSPQGQWLFVSRETIRWSEMGGVMVPAGIVREYQGQRPVSGTDWVGRGVVRFDFHWFSVNEPLPDSSFDAALLQNDTALLRLADPAASKATSLLPAESPPDPTADRGSGIPRL